jgi:branched-chain amino acid transport system ATP-binding protein
MSKNKDISIPTICAQNISKSFGGHQVLMNATVDLRQGQVALLRGSNGSGKTTLLNILTGHLEADCGEIQYSIEGCERQIAFPLSWWQQIGIRRTFAPNEIARLKLGRTWQGIRLFPSLSLGDNIAVAAPTQLSESILNSFIRFRQSRRSENHNRNSAWQRLINLGLGDRIHSSADKISIGQMKRVAIARTLHMGAKVLFLDEPLFGLDAPGIRSLVGVLEQIASDLFITMVIIEHPFNIGHILHLIDTVWTLDAGQLLVQSPKEIKNPVLSMKEGFAEHIIREICGTTANTSVKELRGGARLITASAHEGRPQKPVLEIENMVVYRGNRLVIGTPAENDEMRSNPKRISGISLSLQKGELAILQAPNGWGKTTLLEAIAGIIPFTKGSLRIGGCSALGMEPWTRRTSGLAFLQARNNLFPNLKIRDILRLASVKEFPTIFGHYLDRLGGDLSGGERQMIAIVSALSNDDFCACMLDELFSNLDAEKIGWTFHFLREKLKYSGLLLAMPY